MAKYVFGFRDVRNNTAAACTEGNATKNVVREIGDVRYVTVTDSSAPSVADVNAAMASIFPNMKTNEVSSVSTPIAIGAANSTARASLTSGATSFRHGKAFYQWGIGYHASNEATATAAIVWKNL